MRHQGKLDALEEARGLVDQARNILRSGGLHALALDAGTLSTRLAEEEKMIDSLAEGEAVDALVDAFASQQEAPRG